MNTNETNNKAQCDLLKEQDDTAENNTDNNTSTPTSTSSPEPTFDGVTGYTPINIGGQAVMEGVMMRGKKFWAVAARDEQGEIHVKEFSLKSASAKNAWMRLPVIRGVVALVESMSLGMKALNISAEIAGLEEEVEAEAGSEGAEDTERKSEITKGMLALSATMGIVLAVSIFIFFPAFVTSLILGATNENQFAWSLTDGLITLSVFILYVYLMSFIPDIKRMWKFHGAEHKVIHAVEKGDPLTIDAANKYDTIHTRCGTAFLIMVMALAILLFSLVPVAAIVSALGVTNPIAVVAIRIVSRLMLLPIVAGLAYELTVKWASRHTHLALVKIIMWPGLMMQRLTTSEPDDDMIEVAITATKTVLAAEQGIIKPPVDATI